MSVNQTYVVGGSTVYPAYFQYVSYTEFNFVDHLLVLAWPTVYADNINAVGGITRLSVSDVGYIVRLPPVDQAGVGTAFTLCNIGTSPITIQNENGDQIFTLNAGIEQFFYTTDDEDNPWGMWTQGAGSSSADANGLAGYGLKAYGTPIERLNTVLSPLQRTGEPYNVVAGDASQLLFFNTDVININLPETVPSQGFYVYLLNLQPTIITVNTTGTINGVAEPIYLLTQQSGYFTSDGSNNWYSSEATSSIDPLAFRIAKIDITSSTSTNIILTDSEKNANVLYLTGSYSNNVNIYINDEVIDREWIVHNAGTPLNTTTAIVNVGFGTPPNFISSQEILNRNNSVSIVKQSVILYGNAEAEELFVANNFQHISQGGTSATTVAGAFYNLSPIENPGDMIVGGEASGDAAMSSVAQRLGIGAQNSVMVSDGSAPYWEGRNLPFTYGVPYFLMGDLNQGVKWVPQVVVQSQVYPVDEARRTIATGSQEIISPFTFTKQYTQTHIVVGVTGSYGSFKTGVPTETSYMLFYVNRTGLADSAKRYTTLPSLPPIGSVGVDSGFAPFAYTFLDATTVGMDGDLDYGLVFTNQTSSNYTFYLNQTVSSTVAFGALAMNNLINPIRVTIYELYM